MASSGMIVLCTAHLTDDLNAESLSFTLPSFVRQQNSLRVEKPGDHAILPVDEFLILKHREVYRLELNNNNNALDHCQTLSG